MRKYYIPALNIFCKTIKDNIFSNIKFTLKYFSILKAQYDFTLKYENNRNPSKHHMKRPFISFSLSLQTVYGEKRFQQFGVDSFEVLLCCLRCVALMGIFLVFTIHLVYHFLISNTSTYNKFSKLLYTIYNSFSSPVT